MAIRNVILIDEDKCDGCGECVPVCEEGAIQIVDGKASLVSDVYCDGLGVEPLDKPLARLHDPAVRVGDVGLGVFLLLGLYLLRALGLAPELKHGHFRNGGI
ncbi:MAG: 4Fe-4S binding protein [Actinobacteria bacterium]|nr:4Fe-4S binding protein [Actinomycetota bacterium]MBU4302656.1 4Fe-4S binding protein [Actinomycetota bacterium]